tara:strand:+ start:946 stop:1710 length:765 start_codon:yes stop_codon:yes gene_type:complete
MGSWYNESWKYRYPIAVDVTGGSGSSGLYDIETIIPSKWDAFWDNILSTGFDVLVTDANGNELTFKRTGFNYANKTMTITIRQMTIENNNAINIVWLYWGNPTGSISSATFTPSSPKSGQIYLGKPANMVVGPQTFVGTSSNPISSFMKNSSTEVYIWFSYSNLLSRRISAQDGHNVFEGLTYVQTEVLNASGVDQVAMYEELKTRFVPGYVGVYIKAGSNNTNYQVRCRVSTTEYQNIYLTCLLQVRNQLPSS